MDVYIDLQECVPNVLVAAPRQWGKDEILQRGTGSNAVEVPGTYVYCLPQTNQVRRNMWEAVNPLTGINRIDEAYPPAVRLKKLDQAMTIRMPTYEHDKYSNLVYTGSDNYTALRGMTGRSYNFSEAAFCDPQAFGIVRPIVLANNGMMRFISTPNGQNFFYKMLIDNAGKPNWRCYLITNNTRHPLMDDPDAKGIIHIQSHCVSEARMKEVLEENIQLYGPEIGQALTAQEYECSFEEIVPGSFYLDLILKAEREGRILNLAPRLDLPVYAAFDLGFTDPTAIWYVQVKEDGWIDVIDYDEFTRSSIPEMIPDIKSKSWYYASLLLPHDGPHHEVTSGTTTEQVLKSAGFTVQVMPRTDDATQIPSVRSLLPRIRFHSSPAVRRGIDCLRHFHNKAKTEGGKTSWSPKPVHDWSSHGAKAFATLAYFAPELRSGVQPPKKAVSHLYSSPHQGGTGWMS
jgi:hypothetical protein